MDLSFHDRARTWIRRRARPLERARWAFHFEGGPVEAVWEALAAYQNPDGGFGHGLEPDFWNPDSSPIQTWAATEIVRTLGPIDRDSPLVRGIVRYLAGGSGPDDGLWPRTVASTNFGPHADWWTHPEGAAPEVHELACFRRLVDDLGAEGLDLGPARGVVEARLRAGLSGAIETNPERWSSGYVCRPSRFLRSPGEPWAADYREALAQEVDVLRRTQGPDGTWPVSWAWSSFPEAWAVAREWWTGILILENLLFLEAFS